MFITMRGDTQDYNIGFEHEGFQDKIYLVGIEHHFQFQKKKTSDIKGYLCNDLLSWRDNFSANTLF